MTFSPHMPPLPTRFMDEEQAELDECVNCGAPTDPVYVKCQYCGKDRKR